MEREEREKTERGRERGGRRERDETLQTKIYPFITHVHIWTCVHCKNGIVLLTKLLSNKLQSIYMQHFPIISEVLGIHRVWKHLTVTV